MTQTFALEVDEKLTLRLLKTTDTRKTVLINRGEEDGLVKGDHAKFFTTTGVVARGVLVKTSPTRSIWSLYRLVNADSISEDMVMNLKITPPVKISIDDTKMIVQDDTPTRIGRGDPTKLGIPLAEGAEDIGQPLTTVERAELAELRSKVLEKNIENKNWEIWSIFQVAALSSKVSPANASGRAFASDVYVGAEYYMKRTRDWWTNFTLQPHIHMINNDTVAYDGTKVSYKVFEIGGAVNWYYNKLHSTAEKFLPYITGSFSIGSVNDAVDTGSTSSVSGTTTSMSLGYGLKYYSLRGYGLRLLGDYYTRSDSFSANAVTRSNSGFRILLGLGYRF
jgi:hypothetical protein